MSEPSIALQISNSCIEIDRDRERIFTGPDEERAVLKPDSGGPRNFMSGDNFIFVRGSVSFTFLIAL
jgi:hypothetical protein